MTQPKQPWQCQKCGCYGKSIPREHPRSRLCAWCAQELAASGLRWCGGCKSGKVPRDFTSRYVCRACNSARGRAWRAAHAEQVREHNRTYHAEHADELAAKRRAYYREKREQLLSKKKAYYQANREHLAAHHRMRRRLGLISDASRAKARARHQAKRHIYKANEKLARARRLVAMLRGQGG